MPAIQKIYFPGNQYVETPSEKDIFVIHHSAGWDNARDMFNNWATDTQGRVATAYGITDNGHIYQGFDTEFWGYALYINSPKNLVPALYKTSKHDAQINSRAIQVEICNWGALEKKGNKFYAWPAYDSGNYLNKYEVHKSKVMEYSTAFKGCHYYEKYTDEEIRSLEELIKFHHQKDGIILDYHDDMWNVSEKALGGYPGIWTHVSYRTDKSDAHPQPELLTMLKSLS